jgi:hypothetical protein
MASSSRAAIGLLGSALRSPARYVTSTASPLYRVTVATYATKAAVPTTTAKKSKTTRSKKVALDGSGSVAPVKPKATRRKAVKKEDVIAQEVVEEEEENIDIVPEAKIKAPTRKSGTDNDNGVLRGYVSDPTTPFAHLPDPVDWEDCFQRGRGWQTSHRFFSGNEETINAVVESMQLKERSKAAGRKLTILEGYPGPGTMTRRLLLDDDVEQVICMEDYEGFLPWLEVRYDWTTV